MKKTILIVDDFDTTLFTVGMTLQSHGYDALKASNAEEALKLLDGRDIHLVITDFNMPGKNGMHLTEEIRINEFYKSVPILILSTEKSPEVKREALKKGATGWVKKPYQLDEFVKIIQKVIK